MEHPLGIPWQYADGYIIGYGCFHGLLLCFTGVSPQDHLKVILGSQQRQTDKKTWTKCNCYRFQNHLGCRWVLQMTAVYTFLVGYHFNTHLKGLEGNCSIGGELPFGIPLITPLSQRWGEWTKLSKCSTEQCVTSAWDPIPHCYIFSIFFHSIQRWEMGVIRGIQRGNYPQGWNCPQIPWDACWNSTLTKNVSTSVICDTHLHPWFWNRYQVDYFHIFGQFDLAVTLIWPLGDLGVVPQ